MPRSLLFADTWAAAPSTRAEAAAAALTEKEVEEMRSMLQPPMVVRRLLEAVYWLCLAQRARGKHPVQRLPWAKVVALLNAPGFSEGLLRYDVTVLRDSPLVVRHVWGNYFGPDAAGGPLQAASVRRASAAAAILFEWAINLIEEARKYLARPATPPSPPSPGPVLGFTLPALDLERPKLPVFSPRARASASSSSSCPPPMSRTSSCPTLPPAGAHDARRRLLSEFRGLASLPPRLPSAGSRSAASEAPQESPPGSRPLTPCLRTIAIVAGECRKTSILIARSLFNWPNTLVLLLVHGRDWVAMREEAKLLTRESHRFKVEQLDLDDAEEASDCASMAMARYPSIKGLVIDAKALPELRGDGGGHPAGRVMRGALVAFNALRPYFAGNMRVMVLSSHKGIEAQWLTSKPWQAELFRDPALDLVRLEAIVGQFAEDHAAAVRRKALLPSRAPSGLWLDADGFAFVLLHALVCVWHRQHGRLNFCACVCQRERRGLDDEEVETVVQVMSDDSLDFANVSQKLFGNGGKRLPWFSEDMEY